MNTALAEIRCREVWHIVRWLQLSTSKSQDTMGSDVVASHHCRAAAGTVVGVRQLAVGSIVA